MWAERTLTPLRMFASLTAVMVAGVAAVSGGCGGSFSPTPPPVDQATFATTVASRVWSNSAEAAFLLRPDGVVEWRQGPSDGSMWGQTCTCAPSTGRDWHWNLDATPGAELVVRVHLSDTSTACKLTVTWFSDSSPLDWLILSTPEGERLHFSSAKR